MADLWSEPAHQMLGALASREVSSVELVQQCLARVAALNAEVNAVVVLDNEAALRAARASDAARAGGQRLGPLAGLPFTAKLDYDVAGQATSQGSVLLKDAIATADGPMVRRMRAGAGAVLIGRTNEPDFGVMFHTDSSLYGLTRNPWDLTITAGGSSGGEAAAVGSGMSPLGIGSDYGGSIRTPASFNGVAGFKPSLGRYPSHTEHVPEPRIESQLFTQRGPLARSVRDLVLADEVLRGVDLLDPWTSRWEVSPACTGRVGVIHAPTDLMPSAEICAAVDRAAAALVDAGYQIEETQLAGWSDLVQTYADIALADFGADAAMLETLPPGVRFFLERVRVLLAEIPRGTEASLGNALARRHRLAREFNAFHQRYDLLLMPTWCSLPFPANELATTDGIDAALRSSTHLNVFNLLGLPALSLPAAVVDGLPVGVHVSSLRHHDDRVLSAGVAIESRLGTETPVDPR